MIFAVVIIGAYIIWATAFVTAAVLAVVSTVAWDTKWLGPIDRAFVFLVNPVRHSAPWMLAFLLLILGLEALS